MYIQMVFCVVRSQPPPPMISRGPGARLDCSQPNPRKRRGGEGGGARGVTIYMVSSGPCMAKGRTTLRTVYME